MISDRTPGPSFAAQPALLVIWVSRTFIAITSSFRVALDAIHQ